MSVYMMENEPQGWRAQLGYDSPLKYYFLAISSMEKPLNEVEPDEYLYHNLQERDPWLTLLCVERILAEHGIGLPYNLGRRLFLDGLLDGYPEAVQHKFEYQLAWECAAMRFMPETTPQNWKPRGTLPVRWYQVF